MEDYNQQQPYNYQGYGNQNYGNQNYGNQNYGGPNYDYNNNYDPDTTAAARTSRSKD